MSAAAQFELLMNSMFVQRLHDTIDAAQDRIYIQVMTFDGDSAGLGVAERLIAAVGRGVDVRLTVDSFAFRYISDTRSTDPEIAEEVAATHAMFDRMELAGIDVVYVNPFGRLLPWIFFRNHKKIYVIDEMAYIGGINISDHNFEWLDFNIGLLDPEMVEIVTADFLLARRGERQSLNGPIITNEHIESTVAELIANARESVVIASPYALDDILAEQLAESPAVRKVVVAPSENNFRLFRLTDPYLRTRCRSFGIELRSFNEFFHAKFALIDGTTLLLGSSNFGLHSFRLNQEIAVVIEDPHIIAHFIELLEQTEVVDVPSSKFRYAIGAITSKVLCTGTPLFERFILPHAPTITTR